MKKPLTKCQQCQQALTACRELLAQDTRIREQLREQVKHLEGQLKECETQLVEARAALLDGAQALRQGAAAARQNTLANGAQPSWLVKDFNVLYRVALSYFDATDNGRTRAAQKARRELGIQLERLKSAFTDTEEVRTLMREQQG